MVVVAASVYQIGIILIKEKLCNDNGISKLTLTSYHFGWKDLVCVCKYRHG
jgi:hypothetical protein